MFARNYPFLFASHTFNEDADVSYTGFGEPDTPLSDGNYKVRWSASQFFLTVYSDGTSKDIVVNY